MKFLLYRFLIYPIFNIFKEYFDQSKKYPHKLIKPKAENLNFPLNDEQFEGKFKNGLSKPIPLYLPDLDSDKNLVIRLSKGFLCEKLCIQLPTIIKSKEDIKIVYFYLNKLFNCSFEYGYFEEFIFNPELIKLLFGNVKTPKRVYIENCSSKHIQSFFLQDKCITAKYTDTLFKILTSGGNNFRAVNLNFYNSSGNFDHGINATFYDRIVEYIATSRDCSKIVPVINLHYFSSTSLTLNERAEKVETRQLNRIKYTNYQIANMHNPKVIFFSLCNEEKSIDSTFYFIISKIKSKF
uniref:Uncharacterized protein n=1 Tax=Meloidogyne enterolobii TaxID=390850 RepID=A0A6V7WVH7_MELEN|nr:unnamed protein product [Meloidogyne enterolobii]